MRPGTSTGGDNAVWLTLLGCTSISVLSTGLYTPSLPHLTSLLSTDPGTVQLTLSLNLLAFALAQLVHGPLSDRFGRKRMLMTGLACFLVASLVCALAGGIADLIAGRIAQGAFASVSSVVVAVVIREYYAGSRAIEVMGLYGVALGLVPALGPVIGGYVFVWFGWRANFYILAGLALLVVCLVARIVPETGSNRGEPISVAVVARSYLVLIRNRRYTAYLVPLAGVFGALFGFVTAGPFVLIERLGVATQHYGFAIAVPLVAFMTGSFAANRMAGRIALAVQVRYAVIGSLAASMALLLLSLAGFESVAAILAGMSVFEGSFGVLLAAGYVGLLDAVPAKTRGAASALAGATQVGAGSLAGFLVGTFHDGTALPMAAVMSALCLTGAMGWIFLKNG